VVIRSCDHDSSSAPTQRLVDGQFPPLAIAGSITPTRSPAHWPCRVSCGRAATFP